MKPRPPRPAAHAPALAKLDAALVALLHQRVALVAAPRTLPGLPPAALAAVFREINSATAAVVQPATIAYMGPPSSFTQQAAMAHFGHAQTFVAHESTADVFRAVAKHDADFGVVPIENSNEGAVTNTLDMFVDADVQICAEVLLDIHQQLLSRGACATIKTIYSHPMGFAQCRRWLSSHLPGARCVEVYSTAHAAERAARETHAAAIAGALAAEQFALNIVARNIEDSIHNVTRFLVISRAPAARSGADKTSLLFAIKDRPGALYDLLKPFKDARINLAKIESRPNRVKAWEYYFYVDLIGHAEDANVQRALQRLRPHCNVIKILGSYPLGKRGNHAVPAARACRRASTR
ncbi:MAG: prephenate dehydratase [bacterium]|nr:prephenate dehydratase [bacterium]